MAQKPTEVSCSRNFLAWLNSQQVSLAFTTYQSDRLFLIGTKPDGTLSTFERLFDRAMGLAVATDRLYLATRYQIWQFNNSLRSLESDRRYDRVYVPHVGYTTGDLDIHDLAIDGGGNLVFVNTLYNCLATLSDDYSFKALWQPKFISKLAGEDRCHLNGLAMVEGEPGYVTTVSQSDMTDGWRDHRHNGGCIIDVDSQSIITTGLSMPHSPRYYQGKLWVLNSGRGEFGYVDLGTGKFEPITFCPGYPRGLAFYGNYAVIGVSKPRDKTFAGLDLDGLLKSKKINPRCGLLVIDLKTGDIVHWLWIEGAITELYDVQILPNVRCAMSLGFKTDEIAHSITLETAIKNVRSNSQTVGSTGDRQLSSRELAQNYLNLAKQAKKLGDIETAVIKLRQAIELDPNFAAAYNNLGTILQTKEQLSEAKQCYHRVIQLNPNLAQAYSNLATIWQLEGNNQEAKKGFVKALKLNPEYTPALTNLASIYQQEGDFTRAKNSLELALQQQPNNSSAQFKLAHLLKTQGYLEEAIARFQSLAKQEPNRADIQIAIAQIYEFRGELPLAVNAYQRALNLEPGDRTYTAVYNYTRLKLADWQDYDLNLDRLRNSIAANLQQEKTSPLSPYVLNSYPLANSLYLAVAKSHAADIARSVREIKQKCNFLPRKRIDKKIRLGYISADFRTHVVGRLVKDLFAHHDRDRFTVYGYYLLNIEDSNTKVIRDSCDYWRNFHFCSAKDAANAIYEDEIDILIDLGGYTIYSRPDILALQPAPIQIQFLGYPNTMGADFIQYAIADKWLIADELTPYYTEEIIYLPHAYFGSTMAISEAKLTKADFGFRENTFVFCCFNRHEKIEPAVFAAWMKILKQVPNSILWLSDGIDEAKQNLRLVASKHQIDPARIIFADKIDSADYLARYRVVDLFLDTFIYNAGSTGVDALWGGVPLLTLAGKSNSSRIGASLCAAVGLEEMICQTEFQYVDKAVHLARNPQDLAMVRKQLSDRQGQKPLFDLAQFVRELETALANLITSETLDRQLSLRV